MSFQLRSDEHASNGLRRLARKQLRNAHKELGRAQSPTESAIHEARKSLKKVRAIAQMMEDDDARGMGKATKRLRKVAHALSRVRDADAMFEIVDKLRRRERRLFDTRTLKQLRAWFSSRRKALLSNARRKDTWASADDELRALRQHVKRWKPAHREFGVLSNGLERTHRRGRKAMTRATQKRRADDFHHWRKQIKSLWYQLRLFEPAELRITRDIHQAETWLGDDHNIVVLCAQLSDDSAAEFRRIVEQLKAAADRYHVQARKKAVAAVRHIYRRKSKRYVRNLKRAWTKWHTN